MTVSSLVFISAFNRESCKSLVDQGLAKPFGDNVHTVARDPDYRVVVLCHMEWTVRRHRPDYSK